jgi:single-stranded-DNA-specific exonuclease
MNWKIEQKIDQETISKYPGLHPVILQLLVNRSIESKEEINLFLEPKYDDSHDPFLFRDMEKFVSRIRESVNSGEMVYVYGDYDADGVCSSVLMVETLRKVGVKNVDVYIPHRGYEGYGLNKHAVDFIASKGAKLIITVDCGTSNVEEIAYARKIGLDVIILDHHEEPAELPKDVAAFLNPHLLGETYPFKGLAAVGVVFKAVQALWRRFDLQEGHEKWFLDLVAVATVTDMMELAGENRIFVKYGIVVLNKTQRIGLQSLIKVIQARSRELGVYEIGFMIGPRLNAAGRLDHAASAFELLEASDELKAQELSETLNATNFTRQAETERILKEATQQIETQLESQKILIAVGDSWPIGVVGLVSGKITEKYYRPSLVITKTEKGLTGSGRSIPGFNITRALKSSSDFLSRFGGHEGACGFTLKSEEVIEDFKNSMSSFVNESIQDKDLAKKIKVDAELTFDLINFDLIKEIESMAPFGIGNPTPKFASFGVRVDDIFLMGREDQHMRLKLQQNGVLLQAVGFGMGENWKGVLNEGDLIDIVYDIGINEWQGRRDIQLKIVDIKKE